jgi:hypothetical protein
VARVNVAVQLTASETVNVNVAFAVPYPAGVHVQPAKVEPAFAVATDVNVDPESSVWVVCDTEPLPVPAVAIVTVY